MKNLFKYFQNQSDTNDTTFFKYQGTGNDFIMQITGKTNIQFLTTEQIQKLCDRRFGIGADGLMLLNEKQVMILK